MGCCASREAAAPVPPQTTPLSLAAQQSPETDEEMLRAVLAARHFRSEQHRDHFIQGLRGDPGRTPRPAGDGYALQRSLSSGKFAKGSA